MTACARCAATGEKLKTAACVACGLEVCGECRGDEGRDYWTLGGKKGVACTSCIGAGLAIHKGRFGLQTDLQGQALRLLPELDARVKTTLKDAEATAERLTKATLKDAEATAERLTKATLKDAGATAERLTKATLKDAEAMAERLTKATLKDAEATAERLMGSLTKAVSEQRTGAREDAEFVLKKLKSTVIWAAVILGLINLTAIAAAVLAAKALK